MTFTTLNRIRACKPCADGWSKLMRHLGKTQADDEPLALTTILDSNGLADALWCLRACEGIDREARLYAVWCARQVQHLMTDHRSLAALDTAERHAQGLATDVELAAAEDAARAAAWAAAGAAEDAARAAWAARAAAGAAEDAADAAGAARAAAGAAWAAARDAQAAKFRRVFCVKKGGRMTAPAFIALSKAAAAYVSARQVQDAAEHLHRIRLLARAPESVVQMAAQEWARATVATAASYHELARCASVAEAALTAATVPHPEAARLPLAVEMAQHARQAEMLRQFESECG